jgi:hypothetical protein
MRARITADFNPHFGIGSCCADRDLHTIRDANVADLDSRQQAGERRSFYTRTSGVDDPCGVATDFRNSDPRETMLFLGV